MKAITKDFSRAQKTPSIIERDLNAVLALGQFKGANQSENANTGRVIYVLFSDESTPGKTKAKVFRESSLSDLEKKMNAWLEGDVKIKVTTQTSSAKSNNILTTVFYEDKA